MSTWIVSFTVPGPIVPRGNGYRGSFYLAVGIVREGADLLRSSAGTEQKGGRVASCDRGAIAASMGPRFCANILSRRLAARLRSEAEMGWGRCDAHGL